MSATRLEYHEIREVFEQFNERMNPHVASRLADLAREKCEAAHEAGVSEGYREGCARGREGDRR